VVDLEHSFVPVTVEALDQADDILLVMTLDIPSLRNTKRALKIFDRIGYPRSKVHLVVNRWGKNIDVELQKVEHHLGEQIVGFVPNDYRKVMESINLGQPLVESDPASKISSEIKRIAKLFYGGSGTVEPQPRRGVLKSLFGRQTPSPSTMEFSAKPDEA
jgi:pilus assembly protein CpaE